MFFHSTRIWLMSIYTVGWDETKYYITKVIEKVKLPEKQHILKKLASLEKHIEWEFFSPEGETAKTLASVQLDQIQYAWFAPAIDPLLSLQEKISSMRKRAMKEKWKSWPNINLKNLYNYMHRSSHKVGTRMLSITTEGIMEMSLKRTKEIPWQLMSNAN